MQVYYYEKKEDEEEELGFIPLLVAAVVGVGASVAKGVQGKRAREAQELLDELNSRQEAQNLFLDNYQAKKKKDLYIGLGILGSVAGFSAIVLMKDKKTKRKK